MRNSTYRDIQKSLQDLDPGSIWYQRITEKLRPYTEVKDARTIKKFRIDKLLRIARLVDTYADTCDECRNSKAEITTIADSLGNTIQSNDRATSALYFKEIETIEKHLKDGHHLVENHHYMTIFSTIGTALFIGTGSFMEDFRYVFYILGAAFLILGLWLDHKAKKDGRTI